jgi:hypothetical protein
LESSTPSQVRRQRREVGVAGHAQHRGAALQQRARDVVLAARVDQQDAQLAALVGGSARAPWSGHLVAHVDRVRAGACPSLSSSSPGEPAAHRAVLAELAGEVRVSMP